MAQSYMLQLHFNKGSNNYFGNNILTHFRKSAKSSEIWVFFSSSEAWCTINAWCGHDSSSSEAPCENCDRISCTSYCHTHAPSSASDSPERQSKLLERQGSAALVPASFPPLLICCSVVLLFIWCSLDESSDFRRYVCIIWHISSVSSTWGCWVTWKGFLWSIGLQHGEIPPFIIQRYICCMSWVIQQLYIFPVKCGIPPTVPHYIVGINPVSHALKFS